MFWWAHAHCSRVATPPWGVPMDVIQNLPRTFHHRPVALCASNPVEYIDQPGISQLELIAYPNNFSVPKPTDRQWLIESIFTLKLFCTNLKTRMVFQSDEPQSEVSIKFKLVTVRLSTLNFYLLNWCRECWYSLKGVGRGSLQSKTESESDMGKDHKETQHFIRSQRAAWVTSPHE